jgi:hypothetical protein
MFSRYRSYTCYSEENGKLVPSVEPKVTNDTKDEKMRENTQKDKENKDKITKEVTKSNDD